MAGGGEVAERHPGEGRLADPGRAAEQDQRAGDEAAAEHAVELGDPGAQPVDRGRRDVAQRDRRRPRAPRRRRDAPLAAALRLGPRASTSVFHSPQPAQRPDQASDSWPQALQKKEVVARAMLRDRTHGPRRLNDGPVVIR